MQGDKLMKTCNFQSRKAISTIIGTFFFVVVMVGAFTAFILMMQTNADFLNTQLDTTQHEIQKIQGQFTIAAAYDSGIGNRLCVSVKNAGSTPLEIADLFIVNKTSNTVKQHDIDFRDAFVPASSIKQILTNQPITLRSGTTGIDYDIKVVTTSGIVQTTELKVFPNAGTGNDPRFNVTAFAYPVNAASGQNVTIGAHVFNRMNTTLINVQPNGDPIVDPKESVALGFNFVNKGNITRLDPNESTLFLWEPEFVGGVGSKLEFTVRAKALVEGCTTSSYIFNEDSAQVKIVPGVKKQILASPETFVSFPSPFGQGSGPGIFAVVVQNPTDKPFTVSQVALQIVNPRGADVLRTNGITGVTPTIADWTQATNVITWKGTAVSIPPFDSREFIVRAQPRASIAAADASPINLFFFNVYSSFGQFGKGPFTFGVSSTDTGVVNVYAKSTSASTAPKFEISDIQSGSEQEFHFTIANNGSATVPSAVGARPYLLINIPAGLRNIEDGAFDAGLSPKPLIEFADGSSQKAIEVTTTLMAVEARTYTMKATMPAISVPAHYIFTLTANGTSANSLVGPLSEIVVQVCPPATSAIKCQ